MTLATWPAAPLNEPATMRLKPGTWTVVAIVIGAVLLGLVALALRPPVPSLRPVRPGEPPPTRPSPTPFP